MIKDCHSFIFNILKTKRYLSHTRVSVEVDEMLSLHSGTTFPTARAADRRRPLKLLLKEHFRREKSPVPLEEEPPFSDSGTMDGLVA